MVVLPGEFHETLGNEIKPESRGQREPIGRVALAATCLLYTSHTSANDDLIRSFPFYGDGRWLDL